MAQARRAVILMMAFGAVAAGAILPSAAGSQRGRDGVTVPAAAHHAAVAADGRVAFEVAGDIWISGRRRGDRPDLGSDRLVQATEGPAWDREPAWTADGRALVFVSDRAGGTDLWRLEVHGDELGGPQRLTDSVEPDSAPSVARHGAIVFVRGRGEAADLFVRWPDGSVQRLTERGDVASPAWSPDGRDVLYVSGRTLRRLALASAAIPADGGAAADGTIPERRRTSAADASPGRGAASHEATTPQGAPADDTDAPQGADVDDLVEGDVVVLSGVSVEAPSWSPDGERIAFASRGRGVLVTPRDGRYTNLLSEREGAPAWLPDGSAVLVAELAPPEPGYNGDPDRLGDRREAADVLPGERPGARFWIVPVPAAVDAGAEAVELAPVTDREAYNAEAFDRVWQRLADLYYAEDGRQRWQALREEWRPRALAAASIEELEAAIDGLLGERPPLAREAVGQAAVSSAHPLATEAGVEVLELGGNVVDAAVAVSFALGVVEPDASGVGGYGQMVIKTTAMERPVVVEFLTRAPQDASLDNARYVGDRVPRDGPVVANVPGTVRGMELAWRKYGSGLVEWRRLLEPAIRLAEEGFVLDDAFTTTLARERRRFERYDSSVELFFHEGEPLRAGDRFRNPDLAWTLRRIAEHGADAFYEGEVARRMVEDLRGKGNAMTLDDMRRYFAVERAPVTGSYRGHPVYAAAPPVSGGASLVAKLHLLDNAPRLGLPAADAATLHALIEAWKLVPSSRGLIADPDLWPVDLEPLVDRQAAADRWAACFDPRRATTPEDLETGSGGRGGGRGSRAGDARDREPACAEAVGQVALSWGEEEMPCEAGEPGCSNTGTTAFAVADARGNAVAVTQTLGTWGGNFYVTPGLGFLYNDKLRSYGSDPAGYGARLPYARNSTTIAPTLVFGPDGERPLLAVGAAGNAWINAAVYLVVTGVVDAGIGPQQALELPRFLVGRSRGRGDAETAIEIQIEDAVPAAVLRRLDAMGHRFRPISLRGELRMGYGAAVLIEEGQVRAGADPRRSGAAQAIGEGRQ